MSSSVDSNTQKGIRPPSPPPTATTVITVDASTPSASSLAPAASALAEGRLVAFPTETVYGLGANALDPAAASAIFGAKRRPADNPLIVHVSDDSAMLHTVAEMDALSPAVRSAVEDAMGSFWPGPLTLLLPKTSAVPELVTAGHPTVAVRMPGHPVAAALIAAAGVPIAAPSANLSGRPSPTTAAHVVADLDGRVPFVVDGGPCAFGVESTVVDLMADPPLILRPGGVTLEQLRALFPSISVFEGSVDKPATPGLKYTHYSPDAPVVVFEGSADDIAASLVDWLDQNPLSPPIGLIHTRTNMVLPSRITEAVDQDLIRLVDFTLPSSPEGDGESSSSSSSSSSDHQSLAVAQGLFGALRDLDESGCSTILVESIPRSHYGLAVMNRALKAAGRVIGHTPDPQP